MKGRRRLALFALGSGVLLAVAGMVHVLPQIAEEMRRRQLWADLVPPPQPDDPWRARRDAAVEALLDDDGRLLWALDRLARTDPPAVDPRWNVDTDVRQSLSRAGDTWMVLRRRSVEDADEPSPAPGLEEDGRRRLALRAWCSDAVPVAARADVARWLVQTRLDWGTSEVVKTESPAAMPAEPGPAPRRRAPGGRLEARLEIVALHPPGVMPIPDAEGLDPRGVAVTLTGADETWGTRWVLILSDDARRSMGPLRLRWNRAGDEVPRWSWPPGGDKRRYAGVRLLRRGGYVEWLMDRLDGPPSPALPDATALPSIDPDAERPPALAGTPAPPRAPAPRCVTPTDLDWCLQDHLSVEEDGAVLRLRGDLPHPAVLHVIAIGPIHAGSRDRLRLLERWVSVSAGPVDEVLGRVDPREYGVRQSGPVEAHVDRWEVEAVRDVGIAAVDGDTVWCDDRAEIVVREERDPDRDD